MKSFDISETDFVGVLAAWMIKHGFATGHGDTLSSLLKELEWQVQELRDKIWELEQVNG